MASAASLFQLPTQLKQRSRSSLTRKERSVRVKRSTFPVARLFGPVIFESSKLKVLHLGVEKEKHPGELPRIYTLTHCDITSNITLTISHTINSAQLRGWYNKLQRDEVVAEWKTVRGKMSLHVHCHISGGHFLLDLVAHFRYYIFCKELPLIERRIWDEKPRCCGKIIGMKIRLDTEEDKLWSPKKKYIDKILEGFNKRDAKLVLKAFVHGDGNLFDNNPELQEATVWVYFHSNLPEFNRIECWGPLWCATSTASNELSSSRNNYNN